jgi:multiple sugar transport system substrate-binding protein
VLDRKRTLIAAGAVLMMSTTVLTGCGGDGEPGNTTLTLIAADYGNSVQNSTTTYWDEVVADYEMDHPDTEIEVTVLPWTEVDAEVKKRVAEGKAPDMAQIGAYSDYAADGKLYDADELLSLSVRGDFLPTLSAAGRIVRTQYGMPFASSTRLLFYNKELFAEAGITSPPRTWEELKDAAVLLKEKGVRYPYALPLGPEEAQGETLMWLLSGGDGYTGDTGDYVLDSATNVRTLTWLKDELVGPGLVGPTAPAELDRAEAFEAFTRGEVGMLNGHPTLMRMSKGSNVDYGMVPMPGRTGRSTTGLGVSDWMLAFKQNGQGEEIGKFLDFVYAKENVLDFSRRYDLLPVTNSAINDMAESKGDADLLNFVDGLRDAQLYPVGKTSWPQVSADIKKNVGAALAPDGDPAQVLGGIQQRAVKAERAEQ